MPNFTFDAELLAADLTPGLEAGVQRCAREHLGPADDATAAALDPHEALDAPVPTSPARLRVV